eukprot:16907-Eustigmatos_ZCMA.PRE.1
MHLLEGMYVYEPIYPCAHAIRPDLSVICLVRVVRATTQRRNASPVSPRPLPLRTNVGYTRMRLHLLLPRGR